jgi:hypothetical protein
LPKTSFLPHLKVLAASEKRNQAGQINSKNGQFEGANRIQREQGTLKWEQEKLMVFKHEIEIMTGSSEARLGTVFFSARRTRVRCTLRSKNIFFFD